MTHNFKVGDRVRFRKDCNFILGMRHLIWTSATIKEISTRGNGVTLKDFEVGNTCGIYFLEMLESAEEFQEWEMVLASDFEWRISNKRIYLCTIPWKTRLKYVTVEENNEIVYEKWKEFGCECWQYIKKLPQIKEVTMEEVKEKFWCEVKIINKK